MIVSRGRKSSQKRGFSEKGFEGRGEASHSCSGRNGGDFKDSELPTL